MFTIDTNTLNGTIVISDKFNIGASASDADATPYINNIGEEYTISFTNIQNVSKLTKFTYDTLGMTDTRYLAQYYRLSRDGQKWTTWFDLKKNIDNFPTIDPLDPLYLDIKWVRKGNNSIGSIRILEYSIEGVIERPMTDDGSTVQLAAGDSQIIKPPFIYKVFKLEDVEVISSTGVEGATLKWRYSQDNSRTWSDWEILTKENVSTKRLTPTRFFEVEYSIENTTAVPIKIQDINLIGNFQNVTLDYQKTNLYGLRECCQSNLTGTFDANGNFIPNTNLNSDGSGSCESTNLFPKTTADQQALLYNPYNQGTALNLLNKLSTDAQLLFGHQVIYFVTDPDAKGQDYSMHEYQLYNIVCEGDIKVSVNNNEFPDSQITMNQFDLSLFDNMEVHITKEQFKQVFGIQRRPGKEDFMYFCQLNRMFQVDHVSQFRGFNNSSVYYKLILKKYNQKANVQAGTVEIQNKLDMLTQNSTIDSLFGVENVDDKKAVANKIQTKVLTKDLIRLEYLAKINKELIENASTIISKSNYDLYSVDAGTPAVNYLNSDPILKVSDNIGFTLWFSINNYIQDEVYNFFNYYDDTTVGNPIGWKVNLQNDVITVTLNGDTYTTNSDLMLDEEVWYCYTLNIDQRNRKMSQFIYKRNVDFEEDAGKLINNFLRKVYSDEQDMTPIEFQIENTNPQLLGSDMRATNLRLFTDIIPESTFDKILNQAIIRDDSKYLVFADNANTRLVLPSFPLFE
jgi:hypothetical protein